MDYTSSFWHGEWKKSNRFVVPNLLRRVAGMFNVWRPFSDIAQYQCVHIIHLYIFLYLKVVYPLINVHSLTPDFTPYVELMISPIHYIYIT